MKMDQKDKSLLTNFSQALAVAGGAIVLLSFSFDSELPKTFDFNQGISIVGIISIIALCWKIAVDFNKRSTREK